MLGCRVDASNVVTTVDTWNPSPRETGNVLDDDQDDICMHAGSFDDGRISCRYRKSTIVQTALCHYGAPL